MDNSQFGVLLMIAVIAAAFVLFINRGKLPLKSGVFEKDDRGDRSGSFCSDPVTQIDEDLPRLIVEQLSMKTGKVVHRYSIQDIPEDGVSISRPTANEGDILLDPVCPEANSVSQCHLLIGEDEQGFFVVDNHSRQGTYINGIDERIEGTAVTNGLVLMLGKQPIRFVFPAAPKRQWFAESPYTQTGDTYAERKPIPKILRRVR